MLLFIIVLISTTENIFSENVAEDVEEVLNTDPIVQYCLFENVSDIANVIHIDTTSFVEREQVQYWCREVEKFLECAKSQNETRLQKAVVNYFSSLPECKLLRNGKGESEDFNCLLVARMYVSEMCLDCVVVPENVEHEMIVDACNILNCIKTDCLPYMPNRKRKNIALAVKIEEYKALGKFMSEKIMYNLGAYYPNVTTCEEIKDHVRDYYASLPV